MDRIQLREEARALLDAVYMKDEEADAPEHEEWSRLKHLIDEARQSGAPLERYADGPWHAGGEPAPVRSPDPGRIPVVSRGEFELSVGDPELARDLAALLNWCEVPEPGVQT